MRFNSPPGWPAPPPGWSPPPGWQPDPSWPPPPPGWRLWVEEPGGRRPGVALVVGLVVLAVVAAGGVAGAFVVSSQRGSGPDPAPVTALTTTPTTTATDPAPEPDPKPRPGPEPEPEPGPALDVVATQFGLGPATVGDSVTSVERALGLTLAEQWTDGECVVRLDPDVGIGTVDNAGAVQTYFVLNPDVRTPEGIGVGSDYDAIAAAYPQWIAGVSGYVTDYGGRFVTVQPSPYAQSPDHSASGRHLMFELDGDDRVRRYRVGAPPYVFHIGICSTPE